MGAEGYLVSPAVFKTAGGGGPAPVSSILTCPRQPPPGQMGKCFIENARFLCYTIYYQW